MELLDSTCGGTDLACDFGTIDQAAMIRRRRTTSSSPATSPTSSARTRSPCRARSRRAARCEGALAQSGALGCVSGTICKGATNARTCQVAQCDDGKNNDTDNKIDYPLDPGCTSPSDDDETDDCPNGPNCPACGNLKDDDGDGLKDYPADFGCASASGTTEVCCATDQDSRR